MVVHHLLKAKYFIINAHSPSQIFISAFFLIVFCFNLCHLLLLTLKLLCVREILNLFQPIWLLFHKNLTVSFLPAGTADRLMSGGWYLLNAPASMTCNATPTPFRAGLGMGDSSAKLTSSLSVTFPDC